MVISRVTTKTRVKESLLIEKKEWIKKKTVNLNEDKKGEKKEYRAGVMLWHEKLNPTTSVIIVHANVLNTLN